jgi:biotin transport system substrate-specific component
MPGAWICGWLAFKTRMKLETLAFSAVSGLLVIHICGLFYLLALSIINSQNSSRGLVNDFSYGVMNYSLIPFPGQLVVVFTIVLLAFGIRKLLFY